MKRGKFGEYGGQYVSEMLMPALSELEKAFDSNYNSAEFQEEYQTILGDYAGRPTPLYYAKRLSQKVGCKIYLKREDLAHGGAHKINNTLGQALLALKMGKRRVIAETGAGQHGVATAIACALLGLKAEIYMGSEDIKRQRLNVFRMKLLESEVHPVEVRLAEVCLAEFRPAEFRPAEVCQVEVRPAEVRPLEVRPIEVRPAEVRPLEVRPTEVRPAEVCLPEE